MKSAMLILMPALCVLAFLGGWEAGATHHGDPVKQAERQYRIVRDSGQPASTRCAAAINVAQAYLSAEDQTNYQLWALIERNDCQLAVLNARGL